MPKFVAATSLLCLTALFADASSRIASAQNIQVAFVGTWKLNLAKSTYNPGPPPKSQTGTVEAEGQGLKITFEGINAQSNPAKNVLVETHDGKFHPMTGNPAFDAESETDINDSTTVIIRTKAGKVVEALIAIVSPDRKTWTVTSAGMNANGQRFNNVVVREKQ
jgi:hypothetical protein